MATLKPDQFTHYFTFDVGDAYLMGRVEFNTDKKMTFRVINVSSPMDEGTLKLFMEWLDLLQRIYQKNGKVKRVAVVDLEVSEEPLSAVVEEQIPK